MPRFFNRIRKQLARDNKLLPYSRYAVGEILLVVIGILIALQIDTWNETRKDKLRVRLHLEELRTELKSDLERWQEVMIYFDVVDKAGLYLHKFLAGPVEQTDSLHLAESYLIAGHLAFFNVTDVSYNNLVNSGDINNIENDSIIRLLGLLHSDEEWSKKYVNGGMADVYNAYHNYMVKHVSPLMVRQDFIRFNSILRTPEDLPGQTLNGSSINWENVRRDSTYRQLLNQVVANRIIQKMTYLEWKRDIVEIIGIIDKELKN